MHERDASPPQSANTTRDSLRQGAHGKDVQALQYLLRKIGYLDMDGQVRADGHFGDRTRRAVEAFQYDYGLAVDGRVGALTMAALKHAQRASRC
jgi:peptidoglycan hydrolase-like protein with peptidoglycan-binding domain